MPVFGASMCSLWRALGAVALLASSAVVTAQPVRTEHVTAELVAAATAVRPGEPVQIGLRLQHIPHWHTYWRNPGDSGLPTTLSWTLPAGSSVGEIEWPAPQRLPLGPLVNYGYEGDLLLPLRFTAPPDARPGSSLRLSAEASWLVCREICVPESATLALTLPVAEAGAAPAATEHTAAFSAAAAQQPRALQGWRAEVQHAGSELLLTLDRDTPAAPGAALAPVHVFPFAEQLIEPARHELYRTPAGYALRLSLLANARPPARLDGLAVAQGSTPPPWGGAQRSVAFDAPVRGVTAIALPAGAVPMASANTGGAGAAPEQLGGAGAGLGLLGALVLALLGGMVLNLMPCVFPVLSIKLVGLAQQGPDRGALHRHVAAYGAGVVLSFVLLAAVLLALRAAGSAVGWGFQLQEPAVVFVLALLFFALGLNLMGVFEFGNLLPSGLANWRARRPAADAFATGVLAVVAASPCTAPFMGAALGFAITQPAPLALAVFAMLGLGMALPYAALALLPGWRARLPRPGPWMLRLKQGLAFPMFATVVWLIWVLGLQAGIDGAAKALLALVGLGFAFWLGGLLRHRAAAPVLALALAGVLAWSWPAPPALPGAGGPGAAAPEAGTWLRYAQADAEALVAQGRPVFVDFTAAWCVSCQVNKRLVLNTAATQADFARANVALMRADWTLRDAEITAALARLGRNGVPVYVLMRPGREPLLLPEILTAGIVRDALATIESPSPRAARVELSFPSVH